MVMRHSDQAASLSSNMHAVHVLKGAWSIEEDAKLDECMRKYCKDKNRIGWNEIGRLAGLDRCGKSCRLQWTNYLRPGIKRGPFSDDEERQIIHLHSLYANSWTKIASHLDGRTDNDIKNYWNTHLKKKLIGLGVDPITHLPVPAAPNATNGPIVGNPLQIHDLISIEKFLMEDLPSSSSLHNTEGRVINHFGNESAIRSLQIDHAAQLAQVHERSIQALLHLLPEAQSSPSCTYGQEGNIHGHPPMSSLSSGNADQYSTQMQSNSDHTNIFNLYANVAFSQSDYLGVNSGTVPDVSQVTSTFIIQPQDPNALITGSQDEMYVEDDLINM